MRKFSLQTVLSVIVMVFVALFPLETSADICFNGPIGTFSIDIAASNDQFHSLVGELVTPTVRTPIVGTAAIGLTGGRNRRSNTRNPGD